MEISLGQLITGLHDWQELIAGLLALGGGTFVLLDGRLQINHSERIRKEDHDREDKIRKEDRDRESASVRVTLKALQNAANQIVARIDEREKLRLDFEGRVRDGDMLYPPSLFQTTKLFESSLLFLTSRQSDEEIFLSLTDVVDKLSSLEIYYPRYVQAYSPDVIKFKQLSLLNDTASPEVRRAREQEAAADMAGHLSRSLRSAVVRLQIAIANIEPGLQIAE